MDHRGLPSRRITAVGIPNCRKKKKKKKIDRNPISSHAPPCTPATMNPLHNGKGYIAFTVLHFLAFAMALTVCGLYGVDLTRARESGVAADPKWVFAEVVAGISVFTTLVYLIPFVLRFAGVPIWNLILFILWIAVFGVFGSMYIKEDPEGNQAIQRMKNAVWVDLANALLWLIIAIFSGVYWWGHRERRSRFTGRARV